MELIESGDWRCAVAIGGGIILTIFGGPAGAVAGAVTTAAICLADN